MNRDPIYASIEDAREGKLLDPAMFNAPAKRKANANQVGHMAATTDADIAKARAELGKLLKNIKK